MSISHVLITDTIENQRTRVNEIIDFINSSKSSIAQVNTETDLPSVAAATTNVYYIVNHTKYKGPALACIINSIYKITPLKDQILEGNTFVYIDNTQVDVGVSVNDCVYIDNNGIWQIADATDPTKYPQGIYAPYNSVILAGIAYLPSATLTTGSIYYCNNIGVLTTTPSDYQIGVALDIHTLKIDFKTLRVVSKTTNGLCPQLPNEETLLKFLRQDGTWVEPNVKKYNNFLNVKASEELTANHTVTFDTANEIYPITASGSLTNSTITLVFPSTTSLESWTFELQLTCVSTIPTITWSSGSTIIWNNAEVGSINYLNKMTLFIFRKQGSAIYANKGGIF